MAGGKEAPKQSSNSTEVTMTGSARDPERLVRSEPDPRHSPVPWIEAGHISRRRTRAGSADNAGQSRPAGRGLCMIHSCVQR